MNTGKFRKTNKIDDNKYHKYKKLDQINTLINYVLLSSISFIVGINIGQALVKSSNNLCNTCGAPRPNPAVEYFEKLLDGIMILFLIVFGIKIIILIIRNIYLKSLKNNKNLKKHLEKKNSYFKTKTIKQIVIFILLTIIITFITYYYLNH